MNNSERVKKRAKRDHDRSAKGGIPQANPFVEMLQQTLVNDIITAKQVVTLDGEKTVREAMSLLGRFKILSAPVVEKSTKNLLGFVDVRDICTLSLNIYKTLSPSLDFKISFERRIVDDMNEKFLNTRVATIIDLSHGDPSLAVSGLSPIFQTIGLFQKGVNRVTVLGPDGRAETVISQSDIVRFLVSKIDEFPDIFDLSVNEHGLARKKNLIRINKIEPTIKAISLLIQHKISAVAVINDDGTLIGNFSASDMKGHGVTDYGDGADPFGSLFMPVLAFLEQGGMSFFPVVTVKGETPFGIVLLKLIAMRVHRLWVVDEEDKPIGVITLTDIMHALISQKQPDRKD